MKTHIKAKSVIFNKSGEILLLRRSGTDTRRPHQWDLPGGKVDTGEDYVEAVIREAEEEAGIKIISKPSDLVFSETLITEDLNIVFLIFVSKCESELVTLSFEHEEFAWLTIADALKVIEHDLHKRALAHILNNNLRTTI